MYQFLSLLALFLLSPATTAKKFDYESQVGIVDFPSEGNGCLTIKVASLQQGSSVNLVLLTSPQAHSSAIVQERLTKPCHGDIESDPATSSYRLRTLEKLEVGTPVGMAVTGFSGEFRVRSGLVRADLDGDGVEDSFRTCTSTEGIHLTVWSGEPLKGTRKWHRYYYLGYDVEPTCTEKDY